MNIFAIAVFVVAAVSCMSVDPPAPVDSVTQSPIGVSLGSLPAVDPRSREATPVVSAALDLYGGATNLPSIACGSGSDYVVCCVYSDTGGVCCVLWDDAVVTCEVW